MNYLLEESQRYFAKAQSEVKLARQILDSSDHTHLKEHQNLAFMYITTAKRYFALYKDLLAREEAI